LSMNNNVAFSAVSSMNYLFLRCVANKKNANQRIIHELLENYLISFDCTSIMEKDLADTVDSEIEEGEYFMGMKIREAREIITNKVVQIAGTKHEPVISFYMQRIKELGVCSE
jgi:hypothetical protein